MNYFVSLLDSLGALYENVSSSVSNRVQPWMTQLGFSQPDSERAAPFRDDLEVIDDGENSVAASSSTAVVLNHMAFRQPAADNSGNVPGQSRSCSDDTGIQYKISAQVRGWLLKLGIDKPEGDVIAWREIKNAYNFKVKSAHPDKGGNAEQFKDVNASYVLLNKWWEKRSDGYETDDWVDSYQSSNEYQREMEELYKEASASCREASESIREATAALKEFREVLSELKARAEELNQEIEVLEKKLEEDPDNEEYEEQLQCCLEDLEDLRKLPDCQHLFEERNSSAETASSEDTTAYSPN